MKTFWKDRLNDSGDWSFLELTVSDSGKDTFHLQSGGNWRFKLTNNKATVFWACIEKSYYGVWFLRNNEYWTPETMFIPPISSSQIEESKVKKTNRDIAYWSKFFAKSLSNSNSTFLNNGTWRISKAKLIRKDTGPFNRIDKWHINHLEEAFNREQLDYIDWSMCDNATIIPIKNTPIETEGRLKWWRKVVREGTCPPILVWYINSLDAYLLVDGHYRLMAHMLEGQLPDVLVINQVIEEHFPKDETVKEKILKGIEKRQKNQRKEKLNVSEINNLLIHAFDDRPSFRTITMSKGKPNMEEEWVKEVTSFKGKEGIDSSDLELMLLND